jgi:hypothetical protein
MKIPDDELRSALDEMINSFQKDELAYLVVTSKSELPVRDRLAYLLHKRYEADGYVVAREWNHIDLAVLSPTGLPICLVELKMMFALNAIKPTKKYNFEDFTRADMVKARRYAHNQTAVYSLLLVTSGSHSLGEFPLDVVRIECPR